MPLKWCGLNIIEQIKHQTKLSIFQYILDFIKRKRKGKKIVIVKTTHIFMIELMVSLRITLFVMIYFFYLHK